MYGIIIYLNRSISPILCNFVCQAKSVFLYYILVVRLDLTIIAMVALDDHDD